MMSVPVLLDPCIESSNAGDQVISEAVNAALSGLFGCTIPAVPTRRPWNRRERDLVRASPLAVLGGSNILTSFPGGYRQLRVSLRDLRAARRRVVLLGVGWWQYQQPPDALGRLLLRELLHPSAIHAVRDGYTARMVGGVGFSTVNLHCPSLWSAAPFSAGGEDRPDTVVTVTDYSRRPISDRVMINAVLQSSRRVRIWPQSHADIAYVHELGYAHLLVDPGLRRLEGLLGTGSFRYLGTRLHAAIFCLQRGCPAAVVAVDNRAVELGRDVGLTLLPRGDACAIGEACTGEFVWDYRPPATERRAWLQQLASLCRTSATAS